MKKILVFLIACLVIVPSVKSQIINKEPLSARQTGYKIDAKLDPDTKIVYGTMDAFWVNKSADIVPDAQLHMYMNAYRSSNTTFYKELDGSPGTKDSDYGWIEIKSMTDRDGRDLTRDMQFLQTSGSTLRLHYCFPTTEWNRLKDSLLQ